MNVDIKSFFEDDIRLFRLQSANLSELNSGLSVLYNARIQFLQYQDTELDWVTIDSSAVLAYALNTEQERASASGSRALLRVRVFGSQHLHSGFSSNLVSLQLRRSPGAGSLHVQASSSTRLLQGGIRKRIYRIRISRTA